MKKNLLYLAFSVALLTSCSSAYRSSQTPDDVYYSPGQQQLYADANDQDQYETYSNSSDDNYLRMKARDYERWNSLDDYDYWYDSRYYANNYYSTWSPSFSLGYGYGYYGLGGYNYYNPYTVGLGSYWYNPWQTAYYPYYTVVYYKNPTVYYKPVSNYSLSTYNNRTYNNRNMPLQSGNRSNAYNNSNSVNNRTRNNNNNYYQQNNNRNDNNNTYTPSRSFNSGSSSSSGGGGGGGSRISGGGSRTRP